MTMQKHKLGTKCLKAWSYENIFDHIFIMDSIVHNIKIGSNSGYKHKFKYDELILQIFVNFLDMWLDLTLLYELIL